MTYKNIHRQALTHSYLSRLYVFYGTGCLGLVHWDDPEGWDGEGSGRGGSGWGTHVHPWLYVWQSHYSVVE